MSETVSAQDTELSTGTTQSTVVNEIAALFEGTGADRPQTPYVVSFEDKPAPFAPSEKGKGRGRGKASKTKAQRSKPYGTGRRRAAERSSFLIPPPPPPSGSSRPLVQNDLDGFIVDESVALQEEAQAKAQVQTENLVNRKRQKLRQMYFQRAQNEGKSEDEIKKQWVKVEKMSESDLDFEINKQSLIDSQHFTDNIATLLRDGSGLVADYLFKGGGDVKQALQQDRNLKEAIARRIMDYASLFGLNSQIALLFAGDVLQGLNHKRLKSNNNNPPANPVNDDSVPEYGKPTRRPSAG